MKLAPDTEKIWNQMHERLLVFINARVPAVHDAEDILQDVFTRIHSNIERISDIENLTAWIYRITRNAIYDFYRHRAKDSASRSKLAESIEDESLPSQWGQALLDDGCDPKRVLAGCMESMVQRLPDAYRQAIRLTELDQLTQVEAAQKMGITVSGMKSRVQRGRGKLKEMLLECCEVELDRRRTIIDVQPRNGEGCGDCDCR